MKRDAFEIHAPRLLEAVSADIRWKRRFLPGTWSRRRRSRFRNIMTLPMRHAIGAFLAARGPERMFHVFDDRDGRTKVEVR